MIMNIKWKKITKGTYEKYAKTQPKEKIYKCKSDYVMTNSGNYGWKTTIYDEKRPILYWVISNDHSFFSGLFFNIGE